MMGTVGRGCKQPECFALYSNRKPNGGTSIVNVQDYISNVLVPNVEVLGPEKPVLVIGR